jgi:hypothetical protein
MNQRKSKGGARVKHRRRFEGKGFILVSGRPQSVWTIGYGWSWDTPGEHVVVEGERGSHGIKRHVSGAKRKQGDEAISSGSNVETPPGNPVGRLRGGEEGPACLIPSAGRLYIGTIRSSQREPADLLPGPGKNAIPRFPFFFPGSSCRGMPGCVRSLRSLTFAPLQAQGRTSF